MSSLGSGRQQYCTLRWYNDEGRDAFGIWWTRISDDIFLHYMWRSHLMENCPFPDVNRHLPLRNTAVNSSQIPSPNLHSKVTTSSHPIGRLEFYSAKMASSGIHTGCCWVQLWEGTPYCSQWYQWSLEILAFFSNLTIGLSANLLTSRQRKSGDFS